MRSGERTRIWDSSANGETVTLLHGLTNSLEIWERVQTLLADRLRVIAFDWPGFGEASRPDAAYDGSFFADRLATLLETLDIESTI
ncbi:alpha/beta fold hydrolase [Sphingobium sp. B2]|uniref:alpha/beta fold hydrolase n=1 Tax=Sphingobium sp. B2 TaxID=2583228 RepID=UPI00164397C3|nr:alpha/beta fold hydrolase [Sphingobium sp. B2]